MSPKRRSVLFTLAAIAGGYAALRTLPSLVPTEIEFTDLDNPIGFRRLSAGSVSDGFNPFVGLETPKKADDAAYSERADALVAQDFCGALFANPVALDGGVPVASFSDYYCPFCRVQTAMLADLHEDASNGISVSWHELPLLGETSLLSARAALAAKRQDAYVAFHKRLMRVPFAATPRYFESLADDLGIDHDRLIRDMGSREIRQELEVSASLARLLGIVGTPALIIGRTVVLGQVTEATVARIIDLERDGEWRNTCLSA